MQAQIKIPIPTQRRVLKGGKGMLNSSQAQGDLNRQGSEVSESSGEICHKRRELVATEHKGYPANPETPEDAEVQPVKVWESKI